MHLEQSNQMKKMIHDLRSPISVIKNFLSALEGRPLPDELKPFHAAAQRSAEKIILITDQGMRGDVFNKDSL